MSKKSSKTATENLAKWEKVKVLHDAGTIDLNLISQRGYSNTIKQAYKDEYGEEVVYQDWTKAAEQAGITPTKEPKNKVSVDFATMLNVRKKLIELGGEEVVNKWVKNIADLNKVAGGSDELAEAIKLMKQWDEVNK